MKFRCFLPALTFASLVGASAFAGGGAIPGPGESPAVAGRDFLASRPRAAFYRQPSGRLTTVYGSDLSAGDTAEESTQKFVTGHSDLFGVPSEDLLPWSTLAEARHSRPLCVDRSTGRHRFTLVYYSQYHDGLPVFRADLRLLVRNEPGFPLVLARSALRDLGAFTVAADWPAGVLPSDRVQAIVLKGHPGLITVGAAGTVIWAGYDDLNAEPRLAYQFVAENPGAPARWLFLADAITGTVLFSEDQIVHGDITGSVRANTTDNHVADACAPESSRPMPYARVISGDAAVFADASGSFTIPGTGSGAITVTSPVAGRYFTVTDQAGPLDTLSLDVTPPGPADFLHNAANSGELVRSQVNTYVAANEARDYALLYNPAFPVIATQLDFPINVNLSLTCNAFYNGGSINFYQSGNSCANTGFGTVVHHEYGHHLVASAGSGQGEYGEGMGDVMAVLVTDDPRSFIGFSGNCSTGLRSAENLCQYTATGCSSCGSEIHACGQLLSGCVWSTRTALLVTHPGSYRQVISDLAINSLLLHSGTLITPEITIDFLTLDDDDSGLSNGTPHYGEISSGFGVHGMPAPPLTLLQFDYPAGRPSLLDPAGGTAFTVDITGVNAAALPGAGTLYYSTGAGYLSVPLSQTSPNGYGADFPPIECGASVTYFIAATTTDGTTVLSPDAGPFAPFTAYCAASSNTFFSDDFETDRGWVVGDPADTATGGVWVRGDPIGTAAQPEDDHTPAGVNCFFTGQGAMGGAIGQADVDAGQTTLTSPAFDLSGVNFPRLSYWRWYSNDRGSGPDSDVFLARITNDNGATWTTVETVGPSGPDNKGGWIRHEVDIASLLPPTAAMKIRFIASDLGASSIVEAAVDDVAITGFECRRPCPADFNHDGFLDPLDYNGFINAFESADMGADFNGDGILDPLDYNGFIGSFESGC